MTDFLLHLLTGISIMVVLFTLAWAWSRRWDNYSIVDAVWAFGIGLTAILWLSAGASDRPKTWVAGILIGIWSARLHWHLQKRIRKAFPKDDARYVKLKNVWKGREGVAFFWFFQAQALSVVLLALPFLLIGVDPDSSWGAWEWAGAAIATTGILGESMADAQMARFKARHEDHTAVCQDGLWRYSRHPNYFFESVIWSGFYVYACGSEWGWATFYAPAVITLLVLKVTGIPPTEAAAVASKGDAYRRYQQTTSAFVPMPPKH